MEVLIHDNWIYVNELVFVKKDELIFTYANDNKLNNNSKLRFKCNICDVLIEINVKKYKNDSRKLCKSCKTKETSLIKYGTEHPLKNNKIRKKIKETNLEKYGNEIASKNNDVRRSVGEKNKLIANNALIKRKKTNLEKYGVECTFQTKETKEKIKKTNLEKYNFESASKNAEIKGKTRKTFEEKYGGYTLASNLRDEVEKTNLKRYGTEYPFQSEQIRKKIKQSNLNKYGFENVFQVSEIKEKIESTNKLKYGYKNPNQADVIKIKKRNTNLKKYGSETPAQNKAISNKAAVTRRKETLNRIIYSNRLKNKVTPLFEKEDYNGIKEEYLWRCNNCGVEFYDNLKDGKIPRCLSCYPLQAQCSLAEKEIVNWLKELKINVMENDRSVLGGKEIDIYLPNYKLGIEFNGLYWHSELHDKDKAYHLNKTKLASENNVDLIHIFEDEWLNKEDVVKSIILNKLGLNKKIYARRCEIKEINDVEKFYEENHLQGHVNSNINIGLYYNNELISCLSFSKPRFSKKCDWEITRYANKLGHSVLGGFAKMLKYFRKYYNGSIITYSDLRYFTGKIYENNGFKHIETSKPNYYYIKNNKKRLSRIQFQKHKLKDILDDFDSNLTEWENMQLNGWDRIWDCGNNVFMA